MNAHAREFHPMQSDPVCLDALANDHYWQVVHLRDLLTHLEEISLEEPTAGGDYDAARRAMLFSALALARQAVEEAERLNVNANLYGYALMAAPVEIITGEGMPRVEDGSRQVLGAIRIATAEAATVDELVHALETVQRLADEDATYAADLEALTRLIETRGYSVGWLDILGRRNPRVTPVQGRTKKRAAAPVAEPIDARSLLTADEITIAAKAMAAGLEGYLVSALSNPAEARQPAQETEHAPA